MATDTLSPADSATQAPAGPSHRHDVLKQIAKIAPARLLKMAITLLVIIFLTQFLLIMAERGRNGLPAAPETASVEAVVQTFSYLFNHPATYYLHKADIPTGKVVAEAFVNSAELLLFSLGLATVLGVPLGVFMALSKRRGGRVIMLLVSVLGTSLPSFLLAMLLWIVNIQLHNRFDTPLLPLTGSGLDAHIILPALVLMARPLAQIAQVTYVTLQDIMRQDFIRVAYAKGRSRSGVVTRPRLEKCGHPRHDHHGRIAALLAGQSAHCRIVLPLAGRRPAAARFDPPRLQRAHHRSDRLARISVPAAQSAAGLCVPARSMRGCAIKTSTKSARTTRLAQPAAQLAAQSGRLGW